MESGHLYHLRCRAQRQKNANLKKIWIKKRWMKNTFLWLACLEIYIKYATPPIQQICERKLRILFVRVFRPGVEMGRIYIFYCTFGTFTPLSLCSRNLYIRLSFYMDLGSCPFAYTFFFTSYILRVMFAFDFSIRRCMYSYYCYTYMNVLGFTELNYMRDYSIAHNGNSLGMR